MNFVSGSIGIEYLRVFSSQTQQSCEERNLFSSARKVSHDNESHGLKCMILKEKSFILN